MRDHRKHTKNYVQLWTPKTFLRHSVFRQNRIIFVAMTDLIYKRVCVCVCVRVRVCSAKAC